MNLRAQAAADLRTILEDSAAGFAVQAQVTDPYRRKVSVAGLYRDVDLPLELGGEAVAMSHNASIVFSLQTLTAVGIGAIRNVSDANQLPYVVELSDQGGTLRTYKVADTSMDELGAIVCFLEVYQPA